MEKILIKYHADIPHIEKITIGDFIDLRAAERVIMRAGDFRLISLGVSMKLPEGYYAEIVPRSSTFKNYGLLQANSVGIVDSSYCSDKDVWMFPAYCAHGNVPDDDITIVEKGDRICQFRIVKKQPEIELVEVDHLDGPERGGFGSTGVK